MKVKAWERFWENAIGVFKYIVAGYMMLAGAATIFMPPDTSVTNSVASLFYTHKTVIVILALVIFVSGLILMVGKLKKSKKWTGRGIFWIYLCFFFATILNILAYGSPTYWASNAVMTIIMGLLWLRWKFKTEYVDPKHFRQDILEIRTERK